MSGEDMSWGGATLIGKKVRIRAVSPYGSARLLDGLTGVVLASHPVAPAWVRVRLDFNLVTYHRDWSIPEDVLIVCDSDMGMDEPQPDGGHNLDTAPPLHWHPGRTTFPFHLLNFVRINCWNWAGQVGRILAMPGRPEDPRQVPWIHECLQH
jgi:hypothetical protein